MFVAAVVLACLLAVGFVGAGAAKLAGVPQMRAAAQHLGFSYAAYRRIGALELAGAAGLLVGLWLAPVGAIAAAGLAALMAGAFYFHTKAGDPLPMRLPSAVLSLLALVALAVRVAAAA